MKKLLFTIISAIMVSGLLLGSVGYTAFADVADDNPGKAKGKCDPDNPGKAKNNPHNCGTSVTRCDSDPTDGVITRAELHAWVGDAATTDEINAIFDLADGSEGDGIIDHPSEYDILNSELDAIGIGHCP